MSMCGNAGAMDKRIVLQTNSPSQNGTGEEIASWSTLATVWAEKLTAKAAERFIGGTDQGFRRIVWRIRYRNDLDELARISWDGQFYDVHGTTMEGRKQFVLIESEAVLS